MSKQLIPASNLILTINANVDNEKLTDSEFRDFGRNSLPISKEVKESKEQVLPGVNTKVISSKDGSLVREVWFDNVPLINGKGDSNLQRKVIEAANKVNQHTKTK
jgi:hypothetical protein